MAGAIAGVGIGLLSNIPLIACINCLIFAWVWLGGIAAVYLYQRYEKQPYLSITQGLIVGAVAGAIGALVGGIASLIFGGLSAAFSQLISSALGSNSSAIPSFLLSSGFNFLGTFFSIFYYAFFGAIGGLIATALIWKAPATPQSPMPPYVPPPAGPAQ
jgi:hypothetical protein